MIYEVIHESGRRLPHASFKRIDAAKNFLQKWIKKHPQIDKHNIFIYKMFKDKDGLWYGETL